MSQSSRSSKAGRSYKAPVARKPVTDGEKLIAYMKSLGYSVPPNAKAEHFDYFFEDEEIANFFKAMTKKVQPKNIVDVADVNRFQELVEEGVALFGDQLEYATSRIRNKEVEVARNTQRVKDQLESYDKAISEKQMELQKLKQISSQFDDLVKLKDTEEKFLNAKEEFLKSESTNLKELLDQKRNELVEAIEDLQHLLNNIVINSSGNSQSLTNFADQDWRAVISQEENLVKAINSMESEFLQKMVSQENSREFGLEIQHDDDVYGSFGSVQQNLRDLNRLKHVIIYHHTLEQKLNLEMAGITHVIDNFSAVRDEMALLATVAPKVRMGMLAEIKEQVKRTEKLFSNESLALEQETREQLTTSMEGECQEILDRQFYVKRMMRSFHSFIMKTLVYQRVRLDITRELIRAEKLSDSNIIENFVQFNSFMLRRFEREAIIFEGLQESGKDDSNPEISECFDGTMLSTDAGGGCSSNPNQLQAYQILLASERKKQKELIREYEEHQTEIHNQIKNNRMHLEMLHQLYTETLRSNSKPTNLEVRMSELADTVTRKKEMLHNSTRDKEKIVKESIARKTESVLTAQEMLRRRKPGSSSDDKVDVPKASSGELTPVTTDH